MNLDELSEKIIGFESNIERLEKKTSKVKDI